MTHGPRNVMLTPTPVTNAPANTESHQPGGVWIRPYVADDSRELRDLYAAYTRQEQTLGTPPLDPDRRQEWIDDLVSDDEDWVASEDGHIIGHVSLLTTGANAAELCVFVHPEYFDRGVGTSLTAHAVREGKRGYDRIWLIVERANGRARAVFNRVGFEIVGDHGSELELCYRGDGE